MTACRKCLISAVLVAVLAWILKIYPWQWWARELSVIPPVSYDGRISFNLDTLHKPESEKDISQIITDAYSNGNKVRVLADGHSWSEIAQTQDIMISLAHYYGLIGDVDEEKMEATFKAGTSLRNVSLALDEKGFAMIQLGSVAGQSVAGAISTGTHGTGLTIGNIATLVTKLRIVDGTGTIHELSETDGNTDDFKAAQVSIGMLGVISQITLRVKPKYNLEEFRTPHTLTHCLENMDEFVKNSGHKYVKFWVEFYNDFCTMYRTNETDKPPSNTPTKFDSFIMYYSFAITTRVTYLFPSLTPYVMKLVTYVGLGSPSHRIDNSYLILNDFFELPIHQEGEVIVAYEDCVKTIKAIQHVILTKHHPVNYITEVRFVDDDDTWLSPSYGYPSGSCAVTLTIYAEKVTALQYFNDVYAATERFSARFHWGKHFPHTATGNAIRDLYPKFSDFAVTRKRFDPNGVFLNEFLVNKFGLWHE